MLEVVVVAVIVEVVVVAVIVEVVVVVVVVGFEGVGAVVSLFYQYFFFLLIKLLIKSLSPLSFGSIPLADTLLPSLDVDFDALDLLTLRRDDCAAFVILITAFDELLV